MLSIVGILLLSFSIVIEIILYSSKAVWKHKKFISVGLIFLILGAILCLFISGNWLAAIIFSIASFYRIINLTRLYINRIPNLKLINLARKSNVGLSLAQLFLLGTWVLYNSFNLSIPPIFVFETFCIASLLASGMVLYTTIRRILTGQPQLTTPLSDDELPTVTVAIAARNETPHLTSCLESVVANDYPKLEILVLDDESHDNTAEIIKSFARTGVRFVNHFKNPGIWLAKNNAYQTLLNEASGEIIFYIGVDVRLREDSIRLSVEQILQKNSSMMTIFPKRTKSGLIAAFIQPMRYWWELALPDFLLRRPPALSTCWLTKTADLKKIGGFNSYKRSIIPEEHLAKHFRQHGKYSYIRTTNHMVITSHKDFLRQWDTAVRTRYPHARYNPGKVLLQGTLLNTLIVYPFLALPISLVTSYLADPFEYAVILAVVLYLISHLMISYVTNPIAGILAPFNFPIAITLDILALNVSMYKYEFSKVIWKGRDVVPPKLKVIDRLPEIIDN